MADEPITIFHLEIPLRNPFTTASSTVRSRSVAVVRLGEGPYGWGEAAPYPGQDESIEEVLAAARSSDTTPTLAAGIDEAKADHRARLSGVSLAHSIGATREDLPISVAIGLDEPVVAVNRAVDEGVSHFKFKITPGRIDHVVEIRKAHPNAFLGVDANGSFDAETVSELELLANLDIAYIEQPVVDMTSEVAAEARSLAGAPLFADESVRSVADVANLLACGHIDGIVVKPGRLGWSGALVAREMANAAGKLWRASGLLETGIGRAYTNTLAACPDAFVSDVAPADWFFEADIAVPSEAGVGADPDPGLLEQYLVIQIDLT